MGGAFFYKKNLFGLRRGGICRYVVAEIFDHEKG